MNRSLVIYLIPVLLCAAYFGCDAPQQKKNIDQNKQVEEKQSDASPGESVADSKDSKSPEQTAEKVDSETWRSLFDGKTLDGWETIEFGGEGDVKIVDGTLHMYAGDPQTGICIDDGSGLPNTNYEIAFEAMKLEGSDFFALITFPVNDSFCSMVVGGWGGSLVGLSNLDDQDASGNDTRLMKKFEKDRWYEIRVKVFPDRIVGWIDDEKLIDKSIEGVKVSIRGDVSVTTPLGITNFMTSSAIRNIKLRQLE